MVIYPFFLDMPVVNSNKITPMKKIKMCGAKEVVING